MSTDRLEIICRPLDRWPREFTPDETYYGGRRVRPFKTSFDKTRRLLTAELRHLETSAAIVQVAVAEPEISVTTGWPNADVKPEHPGVIVAADTKHGALKWLCDACAKWTDNVHAIVLTLERLRLADLYGVTGKGEQYSGWKMLPGPITAGAGGAPVPTMSIDAAAVFVAGAAGLNVTAHQVLLSRPAWDKVYRVAAQLLHPDMTGGKPSDDWRRLQDAKQLLDGLHNKR